MPRPQSVEPSAVTRELPALTLRATVRPGSVNPDKRTVDVIFSTGAAVLRGYFDKYYEELSLDPAHVRMQRLNAGAPLLDTHDSYELRAVLGVVEENSASVDGKNGIATVRFAKAEDDPNADAVFRKVKDGIIRNISVGYMVHKYEQTAEIENKIPTYRAVDWEPFEISFVPMGADAGAGARSSDTKTKTACEFIARGTNHDSHTSGADTALRLRLARAKARL